MELLGVQNLKTRSSRNKMLRFKWEPEGTHLLFKEKNGYMEIRKIENLQNADMKQVGLVRNNTYPAFLYVPVLHLVPYEGYISVFKKENGTYIIQPSTPKEISSFAVKNQRYKESGHVVQGDKVPAINLIREDHEKLFAKGYLKYHVVQNGQKLYLRVFPIYQEEAKDLPSLVQAASVCNGMENLGTLLEYEYMSEVTQSMQLQRRLVFPVSFLRKTGAKKGDCFQTWFEEDGSFIIEPNPINCDVCGKPIRRYLAAATEGYICGTCKDALKTVKKISDRPDLRQLKQDLDVIQEHLTELMKSFKYEEVVYMKKLKRKLLSLLLACLMVIGSIVPVGAASYQIMNTPPTEEWAAENGWTKSELSNEYYKTANGIDYVLCRRKRHEYPDNELWWQVMTKGASSSTGSNTEVSGIITIPGEMDGYPVTEISRDSFRSNDNITEIILGEGIEVIGDGAFHDCDNITQISLPKTLKFIDSSGLSDLSSLNEIIIPSSVETIRALSFSHYKGTLIFDGNAPAIPFDTDKFGNSYFAGFTKNATIYAYDDTTGWDAEPWASLTNFQIISRDTDLNPEVPATDITVTSTVNLLEIGSRAGLSITVTPSDTTDELIFSSSDEGVIKIVESNGEVYAEAVGEGKATITATCGSVSDSVTIKVNKPAEEIPVEEIELYCDMTEPYVGDEFEIQAFPSPEGALVEGLEWSSSDPDVLELTYTDEFCAIAYAKAAGTTTITITLDELTDTMNITVIYDPNGGTTDPVKVPVTELKTDVTDVTLKVGEEKSVDVTVEPANATDYTILWMSDNASVATVKDGKITAVGEGKATVTVSVGNIVAKVNVTVEKEASVIVPATSVKTDVSSVELKIGETKMISAIVLPENATDKTISWTSSDPSVATVEDGKITAVGAGEAVIYASCGDIVKNISVVVEDAIIPVTSITADVSELEMNIGDKETVNVTVSPSNATDYTLLWKSDNAAVATVKDGKITATGAGETTVTISCGDVSTTIKVTVREDKTGLPYVDVKVSDWFYEGVADTYYKGLMTGMDPTHFDPYNSLTRGQFVTILYRMEGSPSIAGKSSFPDVAADQFYTKAVIWACGKGIVTGFTSDNTFRPHDTITREQMAAILYRYASYKGYDVGDRESISRYPDVSSVTPYALDAMQWCVVEGIIKGDGGRLNPQGETSRAVCATMILRFTI